MASQQARITRLLHEHGRTYSEEIGIDLGKNTPMPLFEWLCASLLFSTRIGAAQAISAARALIAAGLTTPVHMRDASWEERVRILNASGYARYDESTSTKLAKTSELLIARWGGDLRKLRDEAGGDRDSILARLQEFNGIGPIGAAIFCREVQFVWDELYPFADRKALATAKQLGFPDTAEGLAVCVDREDFPRLLAALVRVALAHGEDAYRG
jgi:hypothetical protein